MLLRPKYKFLIKLRNNVWNTLKPLKFKKLKWRKIKRILFVKKKKINLKNNKLKKKKNFFLDQFRMRNFFSFMLNTKKIFLNTFGPRKKNKIFKIIKKTYIKSNIKKSHNLGFNNITVNTSEYDSLLYLMKSLESKLLATFSRFGIFSNIYVYLFYIKFGYILVNNKVIKNPHFSLKDGDIISFNLSKLQENYDLDFKNLYQNFKCKSKHLIISYKHLKIIFVKSPNFSDMEYRTTFHWDFFVYLLKLKR